MRIKRTAIIAVVAAVIGLTTTVFAGVAHAAPTITLSQSTNLPDVATINVSVGGFAPNTSMGVFQCANGQAPPDGNAPCDIAGAANFTTDASGGASVTGFTVERLLQANFSTDPAEYDCVVVGCFVVAFQNGVVAAAQISFTSGGGGGGGAAITLSPAGPYGATTAVTVTGTGFNANQQVAVLQCANGQAPNGNAPCAVSTGQNPTTDVDGAFSVGLTINETLHADVSTDPADYDCVVVGCAVVAVQGSPPNFTALAQQPLTFASGGGGGGGGTPAITLSPAGPYGATTAVTVTGTGFNANQLVAVLQCANGQAPNGNAPCAVTTGQNATTNGSGDFSVGLTINRTLHADGSTDPAEYNCVVVGCYVVAVQGSPPNFTAASQSLAFTPVPAGGQALGTVKLLGGQSLPLAATPSIGVKACAEGSNGVGEACVPIAITSATTAGDWNLFVPEDETYDIWVVNLGNTRALGGPFPLYVPAGNAELNPEVAVAIVEATVTQNGAPFAAGSAGVGGCTDGQSGTSCPTLRFQFDNDGNGTVALAVPPGTWGLRGFNTVGVTNLSQQNASLDLASGDLVSGLEFTFGETDPPTPEGDAIVVVPVDETTNTSPVTLTFETVTSGGTTSVTSSDDGPPPPTGFQLGSTYYDIETTATFDGTITVCFTYDPVEGELALYHYDDPDWVNITTTNDTVNHVICGATTSLSPFAVFVEIDDYPFSGFFAPVDNRPTLNTVNAGSAVPVKFSLGGDLGLDVLVAGSPKSHTIECGSDPETDPIEQTATASNSGLSYDADNDQYVYVWKTDKAWQGTCRQLVVQLDDGSVHRANFKLN
jgi:hypothetical protein